MDNIELYHGELPVNFEMKCPLALVLDTSGSMEGESIKQLNDGLQVFQQQITNDLTAASRLETMLISFNSEIEIIQDFALLSGFQMPTLKTRGTTKMADAIHLAITRITARKQYYKNSGLTYYRPYIILITDGVPDGDQDMGGIEKKIINGVENHEFRFWAFGVTGADMNLLKKISHPEFPPQYLKGSDFTTFFKWLSKSMTAITHSKPDEKIDISPKSEEENPFLLTM